MTTPRKRYLSIWLPHWAIDCRTRLKGKLDKPYIQTTKSQNKIVVMALNDFARHVGIQKDMTLATARAICGDLIVEDYQPDVLQNQLDKLADWAYQFSPFISCDSSESLILDVTGCPHLFGGEMNMLSHLSKKLNNIDLKHRLGLADTAACAWGLSRYAEDALSIQTEPLKQCIQSLPVEAMQLPDGLIQDFHRMGLRLVTDIMALPRANLSRRYGLEPILRLDQMLGDIAEPITPRIYKTPYRTKLGFPDAIGWAEDIAAGLDRLIEGLCKRLEDEALGAKQLQLICERVNKSKQILTIGLNEASHSQKHIRRLFQEKLSSIEPGFGIDYMHLIATTVEKIKYNQNVILMTGERQKRQQQQQKREDLNILVDRLRNRLGKQAVGHIRARDTYLPDRIQAWQSMLETNWPQSQSRAQPRPTLLKNKPQPIHKGNVPTSLSNDKIISWQGPERISPNWWQRDPNWQGGQRDYYVAQTASGKRYWLYCESQQPGCPWYLHGSFS